MVSLPCSALAIVAAAHRPLAPQHLLYFFPLPQGQGSFRPGSFSALVGLGGLRALSRSDVSSGLWGSIPAMKCHPCSLQIAAISAALSCVWTRTIIGFFFEPSAGISTLPIEPPIQKLYSDTVQQNTWIVKYTANQQSAPAHCQAACWRIIEQTDVLGAGSRSTVGAFAPSASLRRPQLAQRLLLQ